MDRRVLYAWFAQQFVGEGEISHWLSRLPVAVAVTEVRDQTRFGRYIQEICTVVDSSWLLYSAVASDADGYCTSMKLLVVRSEAPV